MKLLLGIILFVCPLVAQIQPVRIVDAGGNAATITTGAISVNCTTGCSSTGSSFNMAFPATGSAVGASDGTNMKPFLVDGSGFLKTIISGALPTGTNVIGHAIIDSGSTTAVTGNVTVVQGTGTNLHVVCDSGCTPGGSFSDNSAFTAGSSAINITGGWYSTTPTNCTTGNACAPQLTIDRKLFVQDFQGTSPWVDNITTWASGTLGAMANYGTSPGAVLVPGVNAFITNTPAVSQSGTWNIGTVTTLTGITNPLPAGTNVIGHVIADSGSTTAVTGNVTVIQGTGANLHTVTDATSVTTATLNAETTKVIGTVRVLGNGGATLDSTVGAGTAPTNAVAVGGVYNTSAPGPTNGQAAAIQLDQAGNQRMFPGAASATLSAWTSATALNATQTIFTNSGANEVLVHLVQTTTITGGAISFQVSYDGTNWITAPADAVIDPANTYAQISLPYTLQANTNKPFAIKNRGWQGLRIILTTQITGTGSVTPNYNLMEGRPGMSSIVLQPTAANLNATVTGSGSAGSAATGVVTVQGIASMTKLLVTPDSVALPANQSVNVSQINGVTPLMGNGMTGTGSLRVTIASDTTANSNPYLVQIVPGTSGGLSTFNLQPAASDNHTVIKNGAGQVYHITATNNSATINYLRLYDAGTGFNGCNSATNLKHEIVIPGNSTNAAGFVEDIAQGIAFANGISICVTSGYGNTDTTNATATAMMVDVDFK